MKKAYKIFSFFLLLTILSTYHSKEQKFDPNKKDDNLFSVKKIEIENNNLISDEEIKLNLKDLYGKNIFFIEIPLLEKSLYRIELIEKVFFKKKYPNTIKVKVHEEKVIALLSKKKDKFFIMESSKLVKANNEMGFKNLPNIFGEESEIYFSLFYKKLKDLKFPIQRIKNFYFFKIGRWDIQLKNDQIIKLPFKEVDESINQSIKLITRKDFSNFKIIDLRIKNKIITE
jgi:cell division septal protein FtsQ